MFNGFRLGPTDDYQATSTVGGIDDFRIYATSLSADEVKKLYGDGNGDFNQKSIEFSYSTVLELPKVVDVYFLKMVCLFHSSQAVPTVLMLETLLMLMRLFRILHGWEPGYYQFELSPDDNSSPANLFVKIDGSGVKTDGFGDTFHDANFSLAYNPETPVILSPSFSHWARGVHSSLRSILQMLLQLLCLHCPRD